MPKQSEIVLALLCVTFAISARGQGFEGAVLQDNSGEPVVSANVRVRKPDARTLAADLETDGEGRFRAPGLPDGEYRVEVTKPGYIRTTLTVPKSRSERSGLTIRMVRCGIITGHVTKSNGQAVTGAWVLALAKTPLGLAPLTGNAGGHADLDDSGMFRLLNLAPGEYAVAVSYGASPRILASMGGPPPNSDIGSGLLLYPNNKQPKLFTISSGEEFHNIDFRILSGELFTISGKVVLPETKSKFSIALTPVDQPSLALAATTTGENGVFRIERIPPGSYHLLATGPVIGRGLMGAILGSEPLFARTQVDLGGQDISGITLAPHKGQTAVISLRPDAGAEAVCPQAASIDVASVQDWGAWVNQTVQVSRQKETTIQNLSPGKYQLKASQLGPNCYQASDQWLDVNENSLEKVAIRVGAAGAIRGHVKDANGTFAVLLPTPAKFGDQQELRIATPDSEGRFEFSSLPPGRYRIGARRISASRSEQWVARPENMIEVEVTGGLSIDVDVSTPAAKQKL